MTILALRRFGLMTLLAVAFVAAAASSAMASERRAPSIDWQGCGGDHPAAECATVRVPLDYDGPSRATTPLALARFPATDPEHRIGTIFVNPGGPGGSGVELVLDGFGEALRDNLGGRFDVVGFDPRGIGASDPIHCFDSEADLDAFLSAVPLFPYAQGQYRPFYDHFASLAGRCLSRDRVIARHMSTADVARDLDLLRRAVGDRRLTYLGFSYGTYIGTTYANLFPGNVRALAIDGVLDPRLWSSGWQIRSDRVATQEEFDEFLRLCREAGPACAFGDGAQTARRWETLARTVEREPIDLGDGFLYTYDFLIGDATGAMYSPEVWGGPDGYGAFLDLLADVALGDQAAKQQARAARGRFLQTGRGAPRGRLPQRVRRLLRQPMRRHRVPGHVLRVPRHRRATRGPDRGSDRIGGGATPAARTGRSRPIATSDRGRPGRRHPSSSSGTTSTGSPTTPGRGRSIGSWRTAAC